MSHKPDNASLARRSSLRLRALGVQRQVGPASCRRTRPQRPDPARLKKNFKELPAGQVASTLEALQTENRSLQRELQRVSLQRDMLNKPWV